uniref:Uncharacterized protein n=1 Tax=Leersia perrieri TaxID=77586 RepID=A0A0D9WBI8_9ORYZ
MAQGKGKLSSRLVAMCSRSVEFKSGAAFLFRGGEERRSVGRRDLAVGAFVRRPAGGAVAAAEERAMDLLRCGGEGLPAFCV